MSDQTARDDGLPEEPKLVFRVRHLDEINVGEAACISYIDALRALCQRNIEARMAAEKVAAGYNTWLSNGVYFTTEEYAEHCKKHREALESAEARARELEKSGDGLLDIVEKMFKALTHPVPPTPAQWIEIRRAAKDYLEFIAQQRALQPEQPDERKES